MKHLFLCVLAIFSLTASAQGLLDKRQSLRSRRMQERQQWLDPNTDIIWSYTVKNAEACVMGVNSVTNSITIPSSIGNRPVTSIGERAFWGCHGLTSVMIPSSVTSIGEWAFSDCSRMTSVTIPSSVMNIGASAFSGCRGLTSVMIPSSVTNISAFAFSGCCGLISVTIPSSVTSIEKWAFSDCSGLTRIDVGPANPSYISSNGLLLTKDGTVLVQGINGYVTIPSSVTSIGDGAFSGCSGLTRIDVDPANLSYISSNGLLLTKNGTMLIQGINGDVTIPSSVTSIGNGAFSGCRGLTSVTIPSSVTSVGNGAFLGCSGLTSVTIPSSVTNIGLQAFHCCSGLKSVTIPLGVMNIGASAFSDCSGLKSVTISSSVTSIEKDAFWGCRGLTSVTIPSSVTSVGNGAFWGCSELTHVYVDEGDTARVKSLYKWKENITFVEGRAK